MKHACLIGLCALVGCASSSGERTALMPVSASCVPVRLPREPEYPDTTESLLAADGADERYRLLIAGRELRRARLRQLEPVIEGCR